MAFYRCGAKPEEEKTVTAGTSAVSVTPSAGKALKKVTVNPTPSQTKSVTPGASSKTVSPDAGKLLSKVTVNGDSDLVAGNIKKGVNIFGVTGTHEGRDDLVTGLNILASDANGNVTDLVLNYPGKTVTNSYTGVIKELNSIENLELIMDAFGDESVAAYNGFTGITSSSTKTKLKTNKVYFTSYQNKFINGSKMWIASTLNTIVLSPTANYPIGIGGASTIYCEATSEPSGWASRWNYYAQNSRSTVVWGVSESEFDAL